MLLTGRSPPGRQGGLYLIPLLALILSAGCFRWVPIEPGYAHGQRTDLGKVRIGGEGGEIVDHAEMWWPTLVVSESGQSMTLDLRQTPVARRELTRGGIAAIVVPTVIGSLAITAAILMSLAIGSASIAGG